MSLILDDHLSKAGIWRVLTGSALVLGIVKKSVNSVLRLYGEIVFTNIA